MLIRVLFLSFLFFQTSLATEVCDLDLQRAVDLEILSHSNLVRNTQTFNEVSEELLQKGFLQRSDFRDLEAVTAELSEIERRLRQQVSAELNPRGLTSRNMQRQVEDELQRRLAQNSDYQMWSNIELESRAELFQRYNSSRPVQTQLDFSSPRSLEQSLRRSESLVGVDVQDATELLESGNYPETIYRFDDDFLSRTNSNGLPKAHFIERNGRRFLAPANPDGAGNVISHVAVNTRETRASDPFISFTSTAEAAERFGRRSVSINMRALLEGIAEGRVRNVDVITPEQLRRGAQEKLTNTLSEVGVPQGQIARASAQIRRIASESDGSLNTSQSEEIQGLIQSLSNSATSLSGQARALFESQLQTDLNFLRHAITSDEVLIRGTVPEEFLNIPRRLQSN